MRSLDIKSKPQKQPAFEQIQLKPKAIFAKAMSARDLSRPKRAWPKVLAAAIVLALLAAYFLGFYVLPSASIEVMARTEPVARDFEIRVDKSLSGPNFAEAAVPGKILEVELKDTKTYPATGTKNIGQKASGFVSIYNFSKTTLILRAGTTVLTAGGREYFFTQDVSGIRPTALIGLEDQEVDPSSLMPPVPVVAALAGPEYNLPKNARLEIKNEAFGQNPKTLYATVAEDLSGGTTKSVKIVSESDISRAYQNLSNDLITRAKQDLLAKYSVTALDNAMAADVLEPMTSAEPGTESPEFHVSVKVVVRAFAFKSEEAKEIVTERIKRLLPGNKSLDEGENSHFSAQFATVSLEEGKGILVARYEGRVVYQVDREGLLDKVKGKNVEEIKEILLSRPEIESAKIRFYPFWVKRAPKFAGKIKVEISSE